MPTQLPRVPSLIPSSFATLAIGRDVSITIFTASSLNSGEKLFLGRGNYFTFPDGPSYWMDCPEGSGHLTSPQPCRAVCVLADVRDERSGRCLTVALCVPLLAAHRRQVAFWGRGPTGALP